MSPSSSSSSSSTAETVITSDELDQIAQQLSDVEETFLSAQRETVATAPCPECGGTGGGDYGSLAGAGCWQCGGTGTVTDEFSEKAPMELPAAFQSLRLEYKQVRGLLDAHNQSVISATNHDAAVASYQEMEMDPKELGARPTVQPAPADKEIKAVTKKLRAELPKVVDEIRKVVRDYRKDKAHELSSGAGGDKDETIKSLEARIAELEKRQLGGA